MTPCNRRAWSREAGSGHSAGRGARQAAREGMKGPMSTTTETVSGGATTEAVKGKKAPLSEGAKAERRLGWLLCAPAVIVMIGVTGYPVGYAVWLSLERYNMELPQNIK